MGTPGRYHEKGSVMSFIELYTQRGWNYLVMCSKPPGSTWANAAAEATFKCRVVVNGLAMVGIARRPRVFLQLPAPAFASSP